MLDDLTEATFPFTTIHYLWFAPKEKKPIFESTPSQRSASEEALSYSSPRITRIAGISDAIMAHRLLIWHQGLQTPRLLGNLLATKHLTFSRRYLKRFKEATSRLIIRQSPKALNHAPLKK